MAADLTKLPPHCGGDAHEPQIGRFRPGTPASQWALARYLVGRSIGASLSTSLLVVVLMLLGVAAVLQWAAHATFWAVVVGVIALLVLAMRALIQWALGTLTAAAHYGPLEDRLRALVRDTRGDILAELRRVGLPGRTWTLPLLALRLVRPSRRRETLDRLRAFDVDRAVSPARVDELHHVLRAALTRSGRAA